MIRPEVPSSFAAIKTNEKADDEFRVYDEETSPARVVQHYKDMRMNHTVAFYRKMEEKYSFENGKYRRMMTIEEAFAELEQYVVCNHFWFGCCNTPAALSSHNSPQTLCKPGCFGSRFGFT